MFKFLGEFLNYFIALGFENILYYETSLFSLNYLDIETEGVHNKATFPGLTVTQYMSLFFLGDPHAYF